MRFERQQALGEVAEIVSGQSPAGSELTESSVGVPFFQGAKDFGVRFPSERIFTTSPKKLAEAGDVLLSVRAPVGRVNRAHRNVAIGRGLFALRGEPGVLLTDFLEYVLLAMSSRWGAHESSGSVFSNLSRSNLASVVIELPSIEEQRAIAEVLTSLDDRIEWAGTLRHVALELLVAVFQHSATERRQVEDVAAVIPGQSPPGSTYNDAGLGLPFYQGSAQFGPLIPEVEKWCSEPQRVAEAGDILFSVRAPVGDLNVAEERCCIGRGVAAIRSPYRATVYAALRSATGEWSIHDSSGTVFGSITGRSLREARIPWPPNVDALSPTLEDFLDSAMAAEGEAKVLKAARAALLPMLVSGEIRIENPERVLDQVS